MSNLEHEYEMRFGALGRIAEELRSYLDKIMRPLEHVDSISVRPKSVERFLQKARREKDGAPKYKDPLNEIQDQVGARIVVHYLSDVEPVSNELRRYIHAFEDTSVVPDGAKEFGYEGKHFIMLLPTDVTAKVQLDADLPRFFELQVKTLFQHAWAEAEHDLNYKGEVALSRLQKRKVAFTAAQAWGADQIFAELHAELALGNGATN